MSDVNTYRNLIVNYKKNMDELRALLKIPEIFEEQRQRAKKQIDKIMLPVMILVLQDQLNNVQNNDGAKIQFKKILLAKSIEEYRKIAPNKITKSGTLKCKSGAEQYLKKFAGKTNLIELKKDRDAFNSVVFDNSHIEKAVLFNAVAYFEQSLSDLLILILKNHPHVLKLDEKKLTFNDIKKFSSLEDVMEDLISTEVEGLLYGSQSNLLKKYEKDVLKINLPSMSDFEMDVVEVKERRNVHMHNSGRIGAKYINNVHSKLQDKFSAKLGCNIGIDSEYLKESIKKLELVGLELLFFAALKFQKNASEREEIFAEINDIVYESLNKKDSDFFLEEKLARFALSYDCSQFLTDIQRDYFQLNYWQILKKMGYLDDFKNQVSKYDTSAKNHVIKLCFYSLIGDFDESCKYLLPCLKDEKFGEGCYEDFAILDDLRKYEPAKVIYNKYLESLNAEEVA